jgi:hypothetical protein
MSELRVKGFLPAQADIRQRQGCMLGLFGILIKGSRSFPGISEFLPRKNLILNFQR